jgi:hypothetical protein
VTIDCDINVCVVYERSPAPIMWPPLAITTLPETTDGKSTLTVFWSIILQLVVLSVHHSHHKPEQMEHQYQDCELQ